MKKIKKRKAVDGHRLDISPIHQNDGFSCGLCAMQAVYGHYNLDTSDLATYLGTGNIPLPYIMPYREEVASVILSVLPEFADLRGTLPQDMMAVLRKDGFTTSAVAGFDRNALRRNLADGHPALALVNWAHWLVVSGIDNRGVWIADSMGGGRVYHKTDGEFRNILTGLVLLRRSRFARRRNFSEMSTMDFAWEYVRATQLCAEMLLSTGEDLLFRKLPGLFR